MTKAQIKARISGFYAVVASEAERIKQVANGAWDQITEAKETAAVRAFLVQQGAGVDYMNRRLPQFLSKDGRVVKFAGVFLHGTPKVEGWTKNKAGKKKLNGECELADLQTVFVYLDSGNTIRQMRCVLFQAKMKPGVKRIMKKSDEDQRRLYDECDGCTYVNSAVDAIGEDRLLPQGSSRKKALQYLFVEPRPVITIPSPSEERKEADYGEHMYRFMRDKTGLKADSRKSVWGKLMWELVENVAGKSYTDGKIRGPSIPSLLKAFNNFKSHDTWCIDSGPAEDGHGVQLVIVWDGEIPPAEPQVNELPKLPVEVMGSETAASGAENEIVQVLAELEETQVIERT